MLITHPSVKKTQTLPEKPRIRWKLPTVDAVHRGGSRPESINLATGDDAEIATAIDQCDDTEFTDLSTASYNESSHSSDSDDEDIFASSDEKGNGPYDRALIR